jgi:hypothetical protein
MRETKHLLSEFPCPVLYMHVRNVHVMYLCFPRGLSGAECRSGLCSSRQKTSHVHHAKAVRCASRKKNPIQSPTTPPPCNYYLLHVEYPSCPPNDAFSRRNCWGRQAGRYLSPARSIDVEASWFMIPPPSHKLFVRPPPFFCSGWFVISSVPYFSVSVKLGRLPGSVWARTFVDDDFLFFLCVFAFFVAERVRPPLARRRAK